MSSLRALIRSLAIAAIAVYPRIGLAESRISLPVQITPNLQSATHKIVFSADGNRVATTNLDEAIEIWDVGTGRLLRTLSGRSSRILDIVFSSDGTRMLSAHEDKAINEWNALDGALLRTTRISYKDSLYGASFSPDRKTIVTGHTGSNAVKVWDTQTGRLVRSYAGHYSSNPVFSANGSTLVTKDIAQVIKTVLKTWDVATGRLKATIPWELTSDQSLHTFVLSPDGSRLLSGFYQTGTSKTFDAKLSDASSGRTLRMLPGHAGGVNNAVFSPDGRVVLTVDNLGAVRFWQVETGRLLRTLSQGTETSLAAAFSPDGTRLISSSGGLRLWEVETGLLIKKFGAEYISGSSFYTRSASQIVVNGIQVWDARSMQLLQNVPVPAPDAYVVGRDGLRMFWTLKEGTSEVYSEEDRRTLVMTEVGSSRVIHTFRGHTKGVMAAKVSPDGKLLATAGSDKTTRIWEIATGKLLRTIAHGFVVYPGAMEFSPDGNRLLITGDGRSERDVVKLWDVASGQIVKSFPTLYSSSLAVAFSPDGSHIFYQNHASIHQWNLATGRRVRVFEGHFPDTLLVSPDGKLLLSSGNSKVKLWDIASGRELFTLDKMASSLAFSPDGRHALISNEVYDVSNGQKLVTMLADRAGEWLAITPEGYFAASDRGADFLSAVQGYDVWSIDQLYQSLYRPDLVREKLAGDLRGAVREAAARLDLNKVVASGNPPVVRVVSPGDGSNAAGGQVAVEAELTPREGGLGRVEWRVNGLTVAVENPAPPAAGQPLQIRQSLSLDGGANAIEVVAYNRDNLIASLPTRVRVLVPAAAPSPTDAAQPKPRLFVLAAGLDDYTDRQFKLNYSVADAEAMARALVMSGQPLYQNVEVKLLRNAEVTREGLDEAFREIAPRIQPSDVFVLYLAGHGKTVDGRYFFVPHDFRIDGATGNAAINAAVARQGIAQEQWQRWLAQVHARRSLVLFDTCESGTLTSDEAETKALEREAANERLAQATGRSIITAASGSAEAIEGYRGHGLFTYNLLDAIDRGDGDRNGTIEIAELAAYVHAQVTAISEQVYKQRQEPQMKVRVNYALTRQARVLRDDAAPIASNKQTFQLAQTAAVQIKPTYGATVVRSLTANAAVTVLKSEGGWSLVASEGRPIGYVATRDLAPMQ